MSYFVLVALSCLLFPSSGNRGVVMRVAVVNGSICDNTRGVDFSFMRCLRLFSFLSLD